MQLKISVVILEYVLYKIVQINWKNRLIQDTGNNPLVSIDGTDFRIQELNNLFNSNWYSKKFERPGL